MKKSAFSLVELIVSITILVILSSLWFISYTSYLMGARDTQRKSDVAEITSALKLTKQQRWSYPIPWNSFNIVYKSGTNILAKQWKLNSSVSIPTLNKLPLDPKVDVEYSYSITEKWKEFELALTLENSWLPIALTSWDYKSVSVNILPTIILAINTSSNVDVNDTNNQKTFIFNEQYNLPYTFVSPYSPQANSETATSIGSDLWDFILNLKANNLYWQNSDYRSCEEIEEAGKTLALVEDYQIVNSSGVLEDKKCTF